MKFVWLLTFFTKKIICIALFTITIITCFANTRPLKTMSNFTLLTMIRVLFAFSTVLTTWFAFSSISYTNKSHLFSISLWTLHTIIQIFWTILTSIFANRTRFLVINTPTIRTFLTFIVEIRTLKTFWMITCEAIWSSSWKKTIIACFT